MARGIGDQVKITATFTDAGGSAADPSDVTCRVKNPAGTTTAYVYGTDAEVVKSSTGVYYILLTLSASGGWRVRFEGTGTVIAAEDTYIYAEPSEVVGG